MCFSPEISGTFFLAGLLITIVSYQIDSIRKTHFHVIAAFYTLMELLQTVQYLYVNKCDDPRNKWLTEFAYVLVVVQPLLWNAIYYMRVSNKGDKSIFRLAIILCVVWIVGNVISRLRYTPEADDPLVKCGLFNNTKTCTYRDTPDTHLYWTWQTAHHRDFTANMFMYLCIWFIPALLVKEVRPSVIVLIVSFCMGWALTMHTSQNIVEIAAIWCYISVPVLVVGFLHAYLKE